MKQLREFAQHKDEFTALKTSIIAISIDDVAHNLSVWDKAANKQFPILSDPGAKVIREYGVLHPAGHDNDDIAIRTTVYVDENGNEVWRRVSATAIDVPTVAEIKEKMAKGK